MSDRGTEDPWGPDGSVSGDLAECRRRLRVIAEFELAVGLRGRVDPSDVVQETLLKAHRSRDQLQGDPFPWLRSILTNTISNVRREHQRECRDVRRDRRLDRAVDDSTQRFIALAADGESVAERMDRDDLFLRVAESVLGLPEEPREAFVLRYWHDASLPEIAERMGKTRPAVAGLLRRSMTRIRDELRLGDSGATASGPSAPKDDG